MVVASIRERQAHNITKTLETPGIWYSRGFLEANQGTRIWPFAEHEEDMNSNAEIETASIFKKSEHPKGDYKCDDGVVRVIESIQIGFYNWYL